MKITKIDIEKCPSCGKEHKQLEVKKLKEQNIYCGWCPKDNEPIRVRKEK
jgi:hypothetical protein